MNDMGEQIGWLLATDVFKNLLVNDLLNTSRLNAAIALLIKARIPFDVSFTPGTRRAQPQAVLKVHINPNTAISFSLQFDSPVI
jgi:hypothetical protein